MRDYSRKRRTRQHVIADLSVNHVERQALLCGYTVQRMSHDYGIDLEITTFNRKGEIETGKIQVQIKATDRLTVRSDAVSFRIERAHLIDWLAEPFPVVLVVFDARNDIGYWLYVQSYFRKKKDFNLFAAGETITVQIATTMVVNPVAMRQLARLRDRVLKQMNEVVHDEE